VGAQNTGAGLLTWYDLPHRARIVWTAMAHMALDQTRDGQPARRYWNGPGYLAEVLYGPAGLEGRDDRGEPIPTPSARRQVEKTLTELVRAGAIRRLVKGAPGRRAEYEVVLTRPEHPTDSVGEHPTESVGNTRPNRSVTPDRFGRPQEGLGELGEREEQHHLSAPRTDARATDHDAQDIPPTPDLYATATTHLERTVGTEHAGRLVAAYLSTHPDAGYLEAVVSVASLEETTS